MKKLIPLLLCTGIIIFVIYSCNRQQSLSDEPQKQQQAKQRIADRITSNGITRVIPVDQKLPFTFVDAQHHEVTPKRTAAASITSACNGTNSFSITLKYFSIVGNCGSSTFQIGWTYRISTNNNVVSTNVNDPTLPTEGTLAFYTSGSLVSSVSVGAPTSITDIGSDPSAPGYELFEVSFLSPASYSTSSFFSPNNIRLGAFIATDCNPDNENIIRMPLPYTVDMNIANLPCNRIDPIQISALPAAAPLRFWGEDPVGACPSGFVYPDLQEINYSIDGGVTWIGGASSSTLSYWLPPPAGSPLTNLLGSSHYGYVDPFGALELQINLSTGPHTVLVRHRNIKFNGALSSYPGSNWPIPVPGTNCCVGNWSTVATYSVTY